VGGGLVRLQQCDLDYRCVRGGQRLFEVMSWQVLMINQGQGFARLPADRWSCLMWPA
jgi:hypothetical protein